MGKVAFVTGWNGISGSAIARHLTQLPSSSGWDEVVVTSRRPPPSNHPDLPHVKFVALDFTASIESLVQAMTPLCAPVTHAFFCSYVHRDRFEDLIKANENLFQHFLDALIQVAPRLEHVTLQTGGKHYNLHLQSLPTPVREDDPPQQVNLDNFYYSQQDYLREKCAELQQQGRLQMAWNVIRPQAIIGSASMANGMNTALTLAVYFHICAYLGVDAPMPTNGIYWEGTDDVSSSALIADLSVYAASNRHCANEAFNVVNGDHFVWRYMWPRIASYFGAQASSSHKFSPLPSHVTQEEPRRHVHQDFSLADWSQGKREVWHEMCDKMGCPQAKETFNHGTWAFQDWVFQRTWNATLSINKARKFGWTGHVDTYDNFIQTFEDFAQRGILPPRQLT